MQAGNVFQYIRLSYRYENNVKISFMQPWKYVELVNLMNKRELGCCVRRSSSDSSDGDDEGNGENDDYGGNSRNGGNDGGDPGPVEPRERIFT